MTDALPEHKRGIRAARRPLNMAGHIEGSDPLGVDRSAPSLRAGRVERLRKHPGAPTTCCVSGDAPGMGATGVLDAPGR
jgi:hypothetical protein